MKLLFKNHYAEMQKVKVVALCVVCVLIGFSCKNKNEDKPPLSNEHIYAKVENPSNYSNVVEVKLMGFDRNLGKNVDLAHGDWKNGGFAIDLPKTLTPDYLYALINSGGLPTTITGTPSTLNISNKNAKIMNAEFWRVDKDGNMFSHFYPFKIDKDGNAKSAFYTYVDSDVTISGYIEGVVVIAEFDEDKNADFLYQWEKTTTYSIQWKKGWNVWCLSGSLSKTDRQITEQWTTVPVSELKWYGGDDLWKLDFYQ